MAHHYKSACLLLYGHQLPANYGLGWQFPGPPPLVVTSDVFSSVFSTRGRRVRRPRSGSLPRQPWGAKRDCPSRVVRRENCPNKPRKTLGRKGLFAEKLALGTAAEMSIRGSLATLAGFTEALSPSRKAVLNRPHPSSRHCWRRVPMARDPSLNPAFPPRSRVRIFLSSRLCAPGVGRAKWQLSSQSYSRKSSSS